MTDQPAIMAGESVLTANDWQRIKELVHEQMKDVVTKDTLEDAISRALDVHQEKTRIQLQGFDVYLRQAEGNMSQARSDMKAAVDEFRQMGRDMQELTRGMATKQAALEEADHARAVQVQALGGSVTALTIREDALSDNMTRQTAELRRISVALFGDKHEDGPESLFKMVSGLSFQIEQVGHRVNGIDEQMKLDGAKWAFVRAGASAAWGAMRGPVGRWVMLAAGGSALGGLVYRILEIVGAMK
jgi:predicted  nucleic acid-binding Zn-ribbon protein